MSTAPWLEDTPDLLTRTLTHTTRARIVTATGEVVPLDVLDGTVSWDETRSPRVDATLTVKAPTDQALLDRIDPRKGARLEIDAGYRRPDQLEDVHPLADLCLRTRRVSRPGDTLTLTARSDESLLIDAAATASGDVTAGTVRDAIAVVVRQVFPGLPFAYSGSAGPAVTDYLFDDRWDAVADLADQIGARVFDNGLRQWSIIPAAGLDTPVVDLTVGVAGTVIASDSEVTRDEGFANYVWLRYSWRDGAGVDQVVQRTRRITSGPYAATTGNTKILRVERTVSTSLSGVPAGVAAESLVRRTVTRGRSFDLEATSAYWLRPGHTARVTLPIGDPEEHLVTGVTFDLRAGTMRVTTRLPDGDYTIGA